MFLERVTPTKRPIQTLSNAPNRHHLPFPPNPTTTDDTTHQWTSSIRSASDQGRFKLALSLYLRMTRSGHRPDNFAVSTALKACSRIPSPASASAIHAQLHRLGHASDVYVQTALVDFYSRSSGADSARRVFDAMRHKNVVSWNSILSAYARSGRLAEARRVFDEMPRRDVVSWNSMLSSYAKAGDLDRAVRLFWEMPVRDSASWNSVICGYIDSGDVTGARDLFERMPERSGVSWIAMISGYSRCGDVESARSLFDRMVGRDRRAWNAMIACYAQNGRPREALHLFNLMRKPDFNVELDEMTFACALSACAQLGDLRFGLWIEEYVRFIGVELDDHLKTGLIDLHVKCGSVDKAFGLFRSLRCRDVVAYSAMILGCGINGRASDSIRLFEEMVEAKVRPNEATFVGLLTAYNHAGLVEEGRRCFNLMEAKHGVVLRTDHYSIMVEMLGRVGCLDEAYGLIKGMPMMPHVGVWGALLLACRLHSNVELGEISARRCLELEPDSGGYYVLLASIYSSCGRWEEAKWLRREMAEKGLGKVVGCSWIDNNAVSYA
ncbi:Pentatricopeptide repeat-containing protein [Acorus gramineus]|uniref:Pentatricopeptide repeat-containing protein n=1 Tax=Acorus gramineus TaxID=55184 RepID=A0AAV9B904_ACOGR|nr:Pentatricopeptide repeat-containing protein [Acorus gramineus]